MRFWPNIIHNARSRLGPGLGGLGRQGRHGGLLGGRGWRVGQGVSDGIGWTGVGQIRIATKKGFTFYNVNP